MRVPQLKALIGSKQQGGDAEAQALTPKGPKPRSTIPDDTEYRPVNWKKIFLSPKYIPWHIVGILTIVATALITIKHDEVVAVSHIWS